MLAALMHKQVSSSFRWLYFGAWIDRMATFQSCAISVQAERLAAKIICSFQIIRSVLLP